MTEKTQEQRREEWSKTQEEVRKLGKRWGYDLKRNLEIRGDWGDFEYVGRLRTDKKIELVYGAGDESDPADLNNLVTLGGFHSSLEDKNYEVISLVSSNLIEKHYSGRGRTIEELTRDVNILQSVVERIKEAPSV